MKRNDIFYCKEIGFSYDDILLVPQKSNVVPTSVDVQTKFSRNVYLGIPISSAPMDTVTEYALAVALANEGGIGIIHRNMGIEEQAKQIMRVKRHQATIITDPTKFYTDSTIGDVVKYKNDYGIKYTTFPVIEKNGKYFGVITSDHLQTAKLEQKLAEVAKRDAPFGSIDWKVTEIKEFMEAKNVTKLPLLDDGNILKGLSTKKDIDKLKQKKRIPNIDYKGRLVVGAAVGVHDYTRIDAVIKAGADVVCIDTAHGHSKNVIDTARYIKKHYDVDVVAGNIATKEATRDLIKADVDGVKVGIGPGSICTTRIVAGVGVPQGKAVYECSKEAAKSKTPAIADGGIQYSGDIVKAMGLGAHSVMIGGLFAGVNESPGDVFQFRGRLYKVYRGMGSLGAMDRDRYGQSAVKEKSKFVPEGVEGQMPARGPLSEIVYMLVGGLKAGMGYCGAPDIKTLLEKSKFIKITPSAQKESHPSIEITKEAPNYSPRD